MRLVLTIPAENCEGGRDEQQVPVLYESKEALLAYIEKQVTADIAATEKYEVARKAHWRKEPKRPDKLQAWYAAMPKYEAILVDVPGLKVVAGTFFGFEYGKNGYTVKRMFFRPPVIRTVDEWFAHLEKPPK